MEYVSRVDGLLAASLSREALADEDKQCRHCDKGNLAVWRCRDCLMGIPMCRSCIRRNHKANPFHRMEQWNGKFFRPAEQWEVGMYLLIPHRNRNLPCDTNKKQEFFLEILEEKRDANEQKRLKVNSGPTVTSTSTSGPNMSSWDAEFPNTPADVEMEDVEMPNTGGRLQDDGDEIFMRYLQELRDGESGRDLDDDMFKEDDEVEDNIEDEESEVPIPKAQRVVGKYVRVVHTNGIHVISMLSCDCHGSDDLASDLLASRLLPTSFERIRTIFSAQLLDYFRLSNLETKASAYHFYHLLQRLTTPMDPGSVVNLYREFRRMSRIWRWMKRLKWAGYGTTNKKSSEVSPGELSVFCPACPQPGINIPDNWKEDKARYVIIESNPRL